MKILFVTTVSGTMNFVVPHIKLLIAQGQQVDVAFNIKGDINPELKKMGCKIYDLNFQRLPIKQENYKAYNQIRKIIIENEYNIVHTHTPIASFITRFAVRNIPDLKVLYTAHGFHFLEGAPLKNWLIYYPIEKIAARWTDILITMNEEDYNISKKMKLRKNGSRYKTHGVGVDLNVFTPPSNIEKKKLREKYGYTDDEFILIYAAELNANKNQKLLIDMIAIVKNKIPNVKLLLAGSGPFKKILEEKVKRLNLNNHVELLGNRNDIKILLKISDIAVASSQREGLPVNIMEAMGTGLPIVATNVRGHTDLVKDNVNGIIVDKKDPVEFSKAIQKLYKNQKLRKVYSQYSHKRIDQYSENNVLKELDNIYGDIL